MNTIENGMLLCPNHSINSRSIFCGSCLMSMSTNTFTSCSLSKMYDDIICSSCFCTDFERFANPYPGKSTRYHSLFIIKWFISNVLPGMDDVLAMFLWLQSILIRLDLPTLLLPMNAYSGLLSLGQRFVVGLLMTNCDFLISIKFVLFSCKSTEFILKIVPLPDKKNGMNQQYPSRLLEKAVAEFSKLPGIGSKTALRLMLHLLRQDAEDVERFADAVCDMRRNIKYCNVCHNISDTDICSICSDIRREKSVICVVENVQDVMAIENTRQYNGLYHVLGGVISPMDGVGPSDVNIDSLVERVRSDSEISEIILALSSTMEGDTTSFYISRKLTGLDVKLTVIARGISVGNELEYTDEQTLARSIMSRTPFDKN